MDFEEETITIVFPSGERRICVQFNIIDDRIALEYNETFNVSFNVLQDSSRDAIPGQRAMANVTIIDNDSKFRF